MFDMKVVECGQENHNRATGTKFDVSKKTYKIGDTGSVFPRKLSCLDSH
jgi:hypothetical protein